MSFNSLLQALMPPPTILKTERLFHGRIFDVVLEEIKEPDGTVRTCEIVTHPGGSVVIPCLDSGNVLLVRQYRYPMKEFILEAPAGKLEPGEDPLECAKRELREETGYTARHFKKLTALLTTPGFCSEVLHIYCATGLTRLEQGQHLDDGEEGLTVESVPFEQAVEMISRGEISDGKTIAGLLLAERIIQNHSTKNQST